MLVGIVLFLHLIWGLFLWPQSLARDFAVATRVEQKVAKRVVGTMPADHLTAARAVL